MILEGNNGNNAVFEKTIENVRKQRYWTYHNRKKEKLFGVRTKLSYYKIFLWNLLAIEMKKKNRDTYE